MSIRHSLDWRTVSALWNFSLRYPKFSLLRVVDHDFSLGLACVIYLRDCSAQARFCTALLYTTVLCSAITPKQLEWSFFVNNTKIEKDEWSCLLVSSSIEKKSKEPKPEHRRPCRLDCNCSAFFFVVVLFLWKVLPGQTLNLPYVCLPVIPDLTGRASPRYWFSVAGFRPWIFSLFSKSFGKFSSHVHT